jgi:hypothetical protein
MRLWVLPDGARLLSPANFGDALVISEPPSAAESVQVLASGIPTPSEGMLVRCLTEVQNP